MKLLVVSNYFESHRGGIEIVAGELARVLATRKGFEVSWMAADVSPHPVTGPLRTIPLRSVNTVERFLGLPLPIPLPRAFAVILREVQKADVLMLHDTLYPSNLLAMLSARRAGKPVMIVQHIGLVPYRNPVSRGLMWLADRIMSRPMLAQADQVVFISGLTQRYFGSLRYRRPPVLIFNGIREDLSGGRLQKDSRGRVKGSQFTAIFVGRFVEKKGLPVIYLLAKALPDIRWLICGWGDEDPEEWTLANVEVRRNLDAEQLRHAYGEADLLVLPSVGEGLPLVVQEALAFGLHVIGGADLLDADPWLRGRISGVAVDLKDVSGTAHRWQSEVERISMNEDRPDCAREARSRYGWTTICDRYEALLQELVADA